MIKIKIKIINRLRKGLINSWLNQDLPYLAGTIGDHKRMSSLAHIWLGLL